VNEGLFHVNSALDPVHVAAVASRIKKWMSLANAGHPLIGSTTQTSNDSQRKDSQERGLNRGGNEVGKSSLLSRGRGAVHGHGGTTNLRGTRRCCNSTTDI